MVSTAVEAMDEGSEDLAILYDSGFLERSFQPVLVNSNLDEDFPAARMNFGMYNLEVVLYLLQEKIGSFIASFHSVFYSEKNIR